MVRHPCAEYTTEENNLVNLINHVQLKFSMNVFVRLKGMKQTMIIIHTSQLQISLLFTTGTSSMWMLGSRHIKSVPFFKNFMFASYFIIVYFLTFKKDTNNLNKFVIPFIRNFLNHTSISIMFGLLLPL
jgi:hypothetical protein